MRIKPLMAGAALGVAAVSLGVSAQTPATAPCAPPRAADPMSEGAGHDHTDRAQHEFSCRITTLASLDLRSVIPEPTMFGEIDVAGRILVIATPFPRAGFVVLDISIPAAPKVLSHYADTRCETKTDFDCGADVKLTPDGRFAFLALQRTRDGDPDEAKRLQPGIVTVDLSDPARPRRVAFTLLRPVGVHMLAYHQIRGTGYVFARARGLGPNKDRPGAAIFRVASSGGLESIGEIPTDAAHDVFPWNDPVDGKTYLALSGAQSGLLYFFDVTDPSRPIDVGRFRPAPERKGNVWYMHNAWEFRESGHRFTLAGPELYTSVGSLGLPPGHGNVAGPVWMLNTDDHAQPRIVGEWRNPGKHTAGSLTFSPHNSWYSGNGITWTAHYHGGIWVLDWRDVLAGRARRPLEIGYVVPSSLRREFVQSDAPAGQKFITAPETLTRPSMWDVVVRDPVAYASDIHGGLVVLQRDLPTASPAPSPRAAERDTDGSASRAGWIVTGLAIAAMLFGAMLTLNRR